MKKIFLILVAVMCFGKSVSAQTESVLETSKFLLLIENTKDGIKLTSRKGCAFKELSFSLKIGLRYPPFVGQEITPFKVYLSLFV